MHLPPPTLSFTIPSIHDDTVLCCRIYHPTCLTPTTVAGISSWRKRAAIVAHPYAPLGGCYDDPVVDVVASAILKQGFIVGTFNFRGAGTSKGRTSWQSKAEQSDYISFVGFLIYYLHHICPPIPPIYALRSPKFTRSDPELHDLSPIQSVVPPGQEFDPQYLTPTLTSPTAEKQNTNTKPRLILAGYSYGALITCSLPPILGSVIAPFQTPALGSAYAEIRLRADSLASQQNSLMKSRVHSLLSQPSRSRSLQIEDHILHSPKLRGGNVRMGGEEDLRRVSHDSHRSRGSFSIDAPERVRRSVDRIRSIGKGGRSPRRTGSRGSVSHGNGTGSRSSEDIPVFDGADEKETIKAIPGILDELEFAYLLVSPLQGFINTLATMWSASYLRHKGVMPDAEKKLTVDPTLALFGDDDIFVSAKRLRAWAEKLSGTNREGKLSHFRHKEVTGAGHFWHSHEALQVLREEVKVFVNTL